MERLNIKVYTSKCQSTIVLSGGERESVNSIIFTGSSLPTNTRTHTYLISHNMIPLSSNKSTKRDCHSNCKIMHHLSLFLSFLLWLHASRCNLSLACLFLPCLIFLHSAGMSFPLILSLEGFLHVECSNEARSVSWL